MGVIANSLRLIRSHRVKKLIRSHRVKSWFAPARLDEATHFHDTVVIFHVGAIQPACLANSDGGIANSLRLIRSHGGGKKADLLTQG